MDSDDASDHFSSRHDEQNSHHYESEDLETDPDDQMTLSTTTTSFEHESGHHEAGKRDVELYIRTYNTLLRSSGEVSLKALVQAHYNIESSLHPEARSPYPDMSALIYSVLRLPASIIHCNLVLLGQSEEVFLQQGFHVNGWEGVTASARRRKWWAPVEKLLDTLGLQERPVYFVSSNTHSLVNLMSGCLLSRESELTKFALSGEDPYLAEECRKLQQGLVPGNWQNFLYFAAREWMHTPSGKEFASNRAREEQERGIWNVGARHGLEIDAQVFELARLHPVEIDPRCRMPAMDHLVRSQAIILNIDYPLGMAAYRMMREIMENLTQIRGIYILGKAATLNGSIGDVMISNVVMDEHSQNTFWLDNCVIAQDIQRYLIYGSVLDDQKAGSAKGTYLQNRQYYDFYYLANYTVIEMESGPYLNAVYEDQYLTRYPVGENINFARLPYDLGILHYASDTPY